MDKFVSAVRSGIGTPGGWFDKFTGDGFLAYWIVPVDTEERSTSGGSWRRPATSRTPPTSWSSCSIVACSRTSAATRGTCRKASVCRSDSMRAPGYLVEIAGELTLVGPPVVGAVRMVTAASRSRRRSSRTSPRRASPRRAERDLRGARDDRHAREPPDQGVPEGPRGLRADVRRARTFPELRERIRLSSSTYADIARGGQVTSCLGPIDDDAPVRGSSFGAVVLISRSSLHGTSHEPLQ